VILLSCLPSADDDLIMPPEPLKESPEYLLLFRADGLRTTGFWPLIGVTVRRERRWTSAGASPARELVRSTR